MKLLVCDFDGTLYQNQSVTIENQASIKKWQEAGNIFAIATGRDYSSLLNKLIPFDLRPDYIIGNNGATIDRYVVSKLDKNETQQVLNKLKQDNFVGNKISLSIRDSLQDNIFNETWDRQEDFTHKEEIDILQLTVQSLSVESAQEFVQKYQRYYPNLVFLQNIQTVDIVASKTDKAHALKLLSTQLNFSNESIFTIGDGLNDIKMLEQYHSASFPWVSSEVLTAANIKVNSVSEWLKQKLF